MPRGIPNPKEKPAPVLPRLPEGLRLDLAAGVDVSVGMMVCPNCRHEVALRITEGEGGVRYYYCPECTSLLGTWPQADAPPEIADSPAPPPERFDVDNFYAVRSEAGGIFILKPPRSRLRPNEALVLAAYIVALVEDGDDKFDQALAAVRLKENL